MNPPLNEQQRRAVYHPKPGDRYWRPWGHATVLAVGRNYVRVRSRTHGIMTLTREEFTEAAKRTITNGCGLTLRPKGA